MMKFKVLFLLTILGLTSFSVFAQRGVRIGYIDTEYILQNVPEYQEASSQLDKKVLQWKSEIEKKLKAIQQKKNELDNESVLLTKELYDERFEDISFEEAEVLDYQQKRFGPEGDLMIQKRQLIEPIQDQIFAAVQEIADSKKYDFVFDKSADVVMLYSAERYDISEQVLRTITRSSKRTQAKNKKERKALEEEAVVPDVDSDKDERQQALDDRKAEREAQLAAKRAEREKAIEDRKKAQEALREERRKEAEERRIKAEALRNGTETSEDSSTKNAEVASKTVQTDSVSTPLKLIKSDSTKVEAVVKKDSVKTEKPKTAAELAAEQRAKKLKEREARQKALEERKQKIINQRLQARKEREEQVRISDSIAKAKKNQDNN